jgi:hypothetical protein
MVEVIEDEPAIPLFRELKEEALLISVYPDMVAAGANTFCC